MANLLNVDTTGKGDTLAGIALSLEQVKNSRRAIMSCASHPDSVLIIEDIAGSYGRMMA